MMIVDKKIDDDDDDDDVTDDDDYCYDRNDVDNIDIDCLKMMLFLYPWKVKMMMMKWCLSDR